MVCCLYLVPLGWFATTNLNCTKIQDTVSSLMGFTSHPRCLLRICSILDFGTLYNSTHWHNNTGAFCTRTGGKVKFSIRTCSEWIVCQWEWGKAGEEAQFHFVRDSIGKGVCVLCYAKLFAQITRNGDAQSPPFYVEFQWKLIMPNRWLFIGI